jgi:hypothetical protein
MQGHQPDQYRAPEGEMDTMTSYNKEYTGKIFFSSAFKNVILSSLLHNHFMRIHNELHACFLFSF